MTIYYILTIHPFPWSFLKVIKSKTKSPKKSLEKNLGKTHAYLYGKIQPWDWKSDSIEVFTTLKTITVGWRKHAIENLPASPLCCLLHSFISFPFLLPSQQPTFTYILNNFENVTHILSLNKLKPLFLNSPFVIMNYTKFMIFHFMKDTIVFVI